MSKLGFVRRYSADEIVKIKTSFDKVGLSFGFMCGHIYVNSLLSDSAKWYTMSDPTSMSKFDDFCADVNLLLECYSDEEKARKELRLNRAAEEILHPEQYALSIYRAKLARDTEGRIGLEFMGNPGSGEFWVRSLKGLQDAVGRLEHELRDDDRFRDTPNKLFRKFVGRYGLDYTTKAI